MGYPEQATGKQGSLDCRRTAPDVTAMSDDSECTQIKLKSKQEEIFEVEKEVACRSVTVKNMVDDTELDTPVPLPMVDSKILIKVIEYCKYHHKADQESVPEDDKNVWDKDFVKVDDQTLFNLILLRTTWTSSRSLTSLARPLPTKSRARRPRRSAYGSTSKMTSHPRRRKR